MRWKRRLFESYEKSMNFKYDPESAKEGLSFEVKEEKRGKTWILKKVLVPTLCSLAGVGIIFTSAHFMLQSVSGEKKLWGSDKQLWRKCCKFDVYAEE